jgi:raffinose/stachyose/melibiose transport system substrate-binding protein
MRKRLSVVLLCLFIASGFLFAQGSAESGKEAASGAAKEQGVTLTFITHKQGMDDVFKGYQEAFDKTHPGTVINYEPLPDYKSNIVIRWSNSDWGDLCMIPHAFISETELPDHFAKICKVSDIEGKYNYASAYSLNGDVYGITSTGTAYGVLYNTAVLKEAGVTKIPTSPDEFFDTLRKVKKNTDKIPLYIDYGAGSRLADWEWNARGSLTGDPDYKNKLCYMVNPFEKGKPYYTVMKMMYDAVKEGLVEDDPSTSKWDTCSNLLAQGKLACTVIGSWAAADTKKKSDHPENIQFEAFPWNINGQQYATVAADYAYAINKDIAPEKLQTAKDYIFWLVDESKFSYDAGGVPILKTEEYPDVLKPLQKAKVIMVPDNPPKAEDIGVFDELNSESELFLGKYPEKARICEAAMGQTKETFDDIMNDWNKRWTAAQKKIIGDDYASKNTY